MKTVVCILIVLLSAAIGTGLRGDIKRRGEWLEGLLILCGKINSEISFRAPPVAELLEKYGTDGVCAPMLRETAADISQGFCAAWRKSAQKWSAHYGLTQEETDTVLMLDALGGSDVEGERRLLERVCERLAEQNKNVGKELATRGKMLFSCSMLAGLAIVILII